VVEAIRIREVGDARRAFKTAAELDTVVDDDAREYVSALRHGLGVPDSLVGDRDSSAQWSNDLVQQVRSPGQSIRFDEDGRCAAYGLAAKNMVGRAVAVHVHDGEHVAIGAT
jgi:hypothetical protein